MLDDDSDMSDESSHVVAPERDEPVGVEQSEESSLDVGDEAGV